MKQQNNRNSSKRIMLVLVLAGVVLTSIAFLSFRYQADMRSENNLNIKREAIEKKDASICEQIEGGIKKQVPADHKSGEDDARTIPAMTEEEAKAECIGDVNRVIELRDSE